MHEITHYIALNAPAEYNAFKSEVMRYLSDKSILKQSLEAYAKIYAGEIETIDDLTEEVSANVAEALLKSDKFLTELFSNEDFIKRISGTEQPKNFMEKVMAKLKELVNAIKDFMKGASLNHSIAEKVSEDVNELEKVSELWTKAFKSAAINHSEVQSIAKENTDTESSGGKYALKEYTEHQKENWKTSKKIIVYESEAQLRAFIQDSLDGKYNGNPKKMYFGSIGSELAKRIFNDTGVEVENYNVSISSEEIRKIMLNSHGDEKYENLRGQRAIIDDDIVSIPIIVEEADEIRLDERLYKNKPVIHFIKTINGKTTVTSYVSQKRFDLGVQTMFSGQKKSSLATVTDEQASVDTPKATSSTATDNNISQLSENVNPDSKNSLPETDSKGKFSLSEPVEQTKDLIAVHNLDEAKLKSVFELGGFAMPSIAVTRADMGHGEFGEISVVFGKETIDPQASESNKVYSSDAWTPTFPTVEYKLNQKSFEHLKEVYKKIAHKFGYDEARPLYTYANESDLRDTLRREKGTEGLISLLTDDTKLMQLYLLDKTGQKVAPVTVKETNRIDDTDAELYDYLIKRLGEDVVKKVKWAEGFSPLEYRKKYFNAYGEQIMDAYGDFYAENYGFSEEQVNNLFENFPTTYSYIQLMKKVLSYLENGAETVIQKEDTEATNRKIIETARKNGYDEWIRDLFGNISEKKGIRNNKDEFTNAGNRRGFETLHYEFTLENVVKAMMEQGEKGISTFQSNIFGASAQNYSSISDIKADSGRLQQLSQEEIDEIRKEFTARFNDIVDFFYPKDNWSAKNTAREVLIEAIAKRKTKSGIASYIRKEAEGWANYSDIVVEDLIELVSDISKMPTTYFEAKPQRVVGLDEIKYAVVPDNISEDLRKNLADNGVSIVEYEQGNETDRTEKLNSLDDVKFSLPEPDTASFDILSRENEDLKAQVEALENEMKLTKGHKVKPEAVKKLARKLLREYSSTMDAEELSAELEKIFNYVADTENASADVASRAMYSQRKCRKHPKNKKRIPKQFLNRFDNRIGEPKVPKSELFILSKLTVACFSL